MQDLEIIILAAGKGTRMSGEKPKVLTDIKGRPMITYILDEVKKAHENMPILVLGYRAEDIKGVIGKTGRYALQDKQLGTGHAVHQAVPHLAKRTKRVMVLYGDHPLIDATLIIDLYNNHIKQDNSPITLGTVLVEDFEDWRKPFYDFGRIVRNTDGKIVKITEKKDASPLELKIREVNPSYFCFDKDWLVKNISKIGTQNAQGEYYLTDLIGIAQNQGYELNSCSIPTHKALGVNTPEQLELVLQFIN